MQTPAKGDFLASIKHSKFVPYPPLSGTHNQTNEPAEEDKMNIETLELNAVTEVTKADETFELLTLSIDDLDLVGGGQIVGIIQ